MTNDRSTVEAPNPGIESEPATESKSQHPYHKPTFVNYGTLAALVKNLTGVGSDGGAPADCTHA